MSTILLNDIHSFKGRDIEFGKQVSVYRNLTRKGRVYSIKQGSKVVAFAHRLALMDVTFQVSHKVQAKIRQTKHRQVHAYAKGFIAPSINLLNNDIINRYHVTYNPYQNDNFVKIDDSGNQSDIFNSKLVFFSENGLKAFTQ